MKWSCSTNHTYMYACTLYVAKCIEKKIQFDLYLVIFILLHVFNISHACTKHALDYSRSCMVNLLYLPYAGFGSPK